jgi:phage baseplate assembly protein W
MPVTEIWSDIHSRVVVDARGSIKKVVNVDSVITSIDNILRTRPGERVMLPSFGAGMQDLVFESTSQDVYDSLADAIKTAIERWDDRVIINSVDFFTVPDQNLLTVKMFFGIRGYDKIFEYSTALMGE